MLLNISGRTDIVNHYSDWLFNRFDEGYVLSRNPLFQNAVRRYELTPDKVDCLIFGSKNFAPVLNRIHTITDKFNTYFYYTITAYGRDIEPGVPDIESSIETLMELSKIATPRRVAWRYDPVLLTDKYTIGCHMETFDYIASRVSPYVDRCVFSFVELFNQLKTNLPDLIITSPEEKDALANGLSKIAQKHHIVLQACGISGDYTHYGIKKSGCVTLDILGEANDIKFRNIKHKGTKKGCEHIESRDIGVKNSCPNGCKYCYANRNSKRALENFKLHDKNSPLLIGHLNEGDKLEQGAQKSFLI